MICVIDYGAGNLRSVENALRYLGAEVSVTDDRAQILAADRVILPGVGAFGDAMQALRTRGLADVIRQVIGAGTPFLGICLGMQLLFDASEESPGVPGLGIYRGVIRRFPPLPGLKIPHVGWNSIQTAGSCPYLADGAYVYFVHSYYLYAEDRALSAATCRYGISFDAAVHRDRVTACQFHPEKSGEAGLEILRRFIC